MEIKAIALDLDGTLLTSDKKISDINRDVLKQLENRGVKVFIVTGRTYISAKPFAEYLGLQSSVIAYNGAKVVDCNTGKVIFELPLDEKYSREVIKLAKSQGFHINLYQNNQWFVEDLEREETKKYSKMTGLTPVLKSFDDFEEYSMTKITVQDNNNSPEFNELFQNIRKKFGSEVYTSKSQDFLFEVLNKNVNKGIILEKILKEYGISVDECVAFGDAENDIEMLEIVKYGVAMGNASLDLKNRVKYITDTNDNNGVAKFLKKYFF